MKTRTGFVSNSSSSSFIIVYSDGEDKCPHCGRSDPNFFELFADIESRSNSNSDNLLYKKYEAIDYLGEWGSWADLEGKDTIDRVIELFRDPPKGVHIIMYDLDTNHDTWELIIEQMKGKEYLYTENGGFNKTVLEDLERKKEKENGK